MAIKEDVLAALGGVRDLERLIPHDFRERFRLAEPMQYGMVCREVSDRIAQLEALGAGPFLHVTTGPPGWRERGVARKVRTEMALGYCAAQQIELLGPGENTDFYAEKIPADGGFALHHHLFVDGHRSGPSDDHAVCPVSAMLPESRNRHV